MLNFLRKLWGRKKTEEEKTMKENIAILKKFNLREQKERQREVRGKEKYCTQNGSHINRKRENECKRKMKLCTVKSFIVKQQFQNKIGNTHVGIHHTIPTDIIYQFQIYQKIIIKILFLTMIILSSLKLLGTMHFTSLIQLRKILYLTHSLQVVGTLPCLVQYCCLKH